MNLAETGTSNIVIGFNRYMVECEFGKHCFALCDECTFNRYMVECEFIHQGNSCHIFPVLIDTWWNVNVASAEAGEDAALVLIDTWWNVNFV